MSLAPVALFVYKRPQSTQKVISTLLQNELSSKTQLIIFSDGAKRPEDEEGVRKVRQFIQTIKGFSSIQVVEREKNMGLSASIIDGVTKICDQFGKVIVLEDDLQVAPYFLKYMNDALRLYKDNQEVASVHGYVYPISGLPDTFFLKGADCWGWATWKRGWDLFEPDGEQLYQDLIDSGRSSLFDFNGQSKYMKMLQDQMEGKIDSWAIRWYASAFLKNRFTLYSGRSLVKNVGADGSGTHIGKTDIFDTPLRLTPIVLTRQPISQDSGAFNAFCQYFYSVKPSLWTKLRNKVRRLFA